VLAKPNKESFPRGSNEEEEEVEEEAKSVGSLTQKLFFYTKKDKAVAFKIIQKRS
jgi:hypothetical protein